jgi:hypothetical protein
MHKKQYNKYNHLKRETPTPQSDSFLLAEQITKRVSGGGEYDRDREVDESGEQPGTQEKRHHQLRVPDRVHLEVVADTSQKQEEVAHVVQEKNHRTDRVLVDQVLVRYQDQSHHVVEQHFVIGRFALFY